MLALVVAAVALYWQYLHRRDAVQPITMTQENLGFSMFNNGDHPVKLQRLTISWDNRDYMIVTDADSSMVGIFQTVELRAPTVPPSHEST